MLSIYLLTALCWFLGGIAGGATAMGTVMISLPLTTLFLAPADAVIVACLVGIAAVFQLAWAYRRAYSWHDIRDLVIGTVPGSLLGAFVLKHAPVSALQIMVSLILACFVLMKTTGVVSRFRLPDGRASGLAGGVVCGFVGTSVAMSGAPLGVYVLLSGWEPDRVRGNVSMYYLFSCIPITLVQFFGGFYTLPLCGIALAGAAGSFAGQQVGIVLGRRISRVVFFRIIVGFLALASVMLFVRGVCS